MFAIQKCATELHDAQGRYTLAGYAVVWYGHATMMETYRTRVEKSTGWVPRVSGVTSPRMKRAVWVWIDTHQLHFTVLAAACDTRVEHLVLAAVYLIIDIYKLIFTINRQSNQAIHIFHSMS